MRSLFYILVLTSTLQARAQIPNSSAPPSSESATKSQAPNSAAPHSQTQDSDSSATSPSSAKSAANLPGPNSAPPRSDRVDAASLDDSGDSSSKDTQIDLSPPPGEDKAGTGNPGSEDGISADGVGEFHSWDPHKAAKDIEVGDFYFRRRNYIAAESRYREALTYKANDATATFKLAVCLDKMSRPEEARVEFEAYLKILPYGSEASEAKKAIERLKIPVAGSHPAK
jgi:tetratricopeptide (TPR) repeat protein